MAEGNPISALALVEIVPEILTLGEVVVTFLEGGSVVATAVAPKAQRIPESVKTKVATHEDGTGVLKVSDAIECVEEYFNSGALIGQLAQILVTNFINSTPQGVGAIAIPQIAACLRRKRLFQYHPLHKEKTLGNTRKRA